MNKTTEALRIFNQERDWEQFHTPENLAKSIAIEAGELLECFQWNNDYERAQVESELADVATYCLMLADKLDVDLDELILKKLAITNQKYPIELAKGKSTKYTKLKK